jgi:hypothetical protein
MRPAAVGVSVAQINLFLNTILASLVGANVVSYLYYSDRLVEFPLGVFGVALGTVVLPMLSRQAAEQSPQFRHTLDWALRLTWLIGLPATIGLLLLGVVMIWSTSLGIGGAGVPRRTNRRGHAGITGVTRWAGRWIRGTSGGRRGQGGSGHPADAGADGRTGQGAARLVADDRPRQSAEERATGSAGGRT